MNDSVSPASPWRRRADVTYRKEENMKWSGVRIAVAVAAAVSSLSASVRADLTHRYSFTTDASDSVGGLNGTLVNTATVAGGALQFNNPNFSPAGGGYLSLSPSILPSSGGATIETWFTMQGSGFFTEAFTFTDNNNGANPPGSNNGMYLMGTISAPQPATPPGGANTGGSHIDASIAGFAGGEVDAYEETPGLGAGGGGYLDDGETFMMSMTIDATGNLSYYLYDLSQGGTGGLQETVPGYMLSQFAFTNAFLGRSAFPGDNSTSGAIDEFRVFNTALSASDIAADEAAGPNTVASVPEPGSLALAGLGAIGLMRRRRAR